MYNNDGLERLLNDVLQSLNAEDAEKERIAKESISVEDRIRVGCISAWRCLQYRDGDSIRFYTDGILRAITGQELV